MSTEKSEAPRGHINPRLGPRLGPYPLAAAGYALYGVVYLVGAVLALTPARMVTFFGFVPWWVFYVVGGALVLTLPVLVYRRYKWLTRVLALGPAGKALTLCWQQGKLLAGDAEAGSPLRASYDWFFLAIAVMAAVLLFRAGFGPQQGGADSR